MGILDQITQMKRQGMRDEDIVSDLSQQGVSPREINDALNQSQIKQAVSNPGGGEEMQPSIMPGGEIPAPNQQTQEYAPQAYEEPQQEYASQGYQQPQQEYQAQEQQYYEPGGYEQYAPTGTDTDTIMEIADQVFSDKIKKIQKQLDATSEAAILLETKTENISERLKKIENMIDKLQIAILEKVGSYGKNLENIKKEMSMMQNSFSKMITKSRTKEKELKKYAPIKELKKLKKKTSKKK